MSRARWASRSASVRRRLGELREDAPGALDPSPSDRDVAAEVVRVHGQHDRHAGRAATIPLPAVQAVGPLVRAHRDRLVMPPPRGDAEALEQLAVLPVGEQGLEARTRLVPPAVRQRRAGRLDRHAVTIPAESPAG